MMKNLVITCLLLCLSLLASAQVSVHFTGGMSNMYNVATSNIEVSYRYKPVSLSVGYINMITTRSDVPMVFFSKVGGNINVGDGTITASAGVAWHDYNENKVKEQAYHPLYGITYQKPLGLKCSVVITALVTHSVFYTGVGLCYTFKSKSDGESQ